MKGITKPKIHYAWIIVAAEFVLCGICVGTLINSMGVFVKPVSEGLGVNRSQFTLVVSLSSLVSTFCYPFWGNYMKAKSIRRNYIISAVVIPFIFFGYSFSKKLWQFYMLSCVLGVFSASVTSLATSSLLNRWFVDKRGVAVSLATCGSGLIPSLFVPIITGLIDRHSWQYGYRWVAVVYGAVVMFLSLFFIKDWPSQLGLEPYAEPGKEKNISEKAKGGVDRKAALKCSSFYYLAAGAFICGAIYSGINTNVQAYLTDIGYSTAVASRTVSVSMLSMICMKLVMGVIFDRSGFRSCYILAITGSFLSAFALFLAEFRPALYLHSFAFGIASAFPALCCTYGTLHLFGQKDFSYICSLVTSILYIGLAVGPTVLSAIYDFSGSYSASWILTAILSVLAFILLTAATGFPQSLKQKQ